MQYLKKWKNLLILETFVTLLVFTGMQKHCKNLSCYNFGVIWMTFFEIHSVCPWGIWNAKITNLNWGEAFPSFLANFLSIRVHLIIRLWTFARSMGVLNNLIGSEKYLLHSFNNSETEVWFLSNNLTRPKVKKTHLTNVLAPKSWPYFYQNLQPKPVEKARRACQGKIECSLSPKNQFDFSS